MCGIVAIAGRDATAPGDIERGVRAIRHRGPDGEGIWRSPDGRAALGHARLAILDLSPLGAQPMRSADGQGFLSYNGEIYNFRELASRLQTPIRSRSDTEIVLELLRQRGIEAIQLFRGMFAFAYWNGEELLLVRDRLGIKPLFFTEEGDRIIAASEIGAVLATRQTSPRIDGRALDDYLTYLYVPPPRTGITGVRELPPGHWLRWRPGRSSVVERYWRVPSHASSRTTSPVRVREILEDAVQTHLVSDAPVGVFLSGGLDSSSIVALAARHYPGTLKTFSVTFGDEGTYLDERGFARQIAHRYGADHREIDVRADVAHILPELVAHFGQPFGNPTAVLTYALARATREHVKVALAGDGGDEVLGGYPRYQGLWIADVVHRAPDAARRRFLGALERLAPKHSTRGLLGNRIARFLRHADQSPEGMYYRWVSYLDEARKADLLVDRASLLDEDPPREPYEFLAAKRAVHSDVPMRDAASLVDVESFLPCNVLAYGDRMSMAHALEVRVPYCDHLVVEQLAPLPLAAKMPAGVQKGLFRWAMRAELPAAVLLHRKIGFNPPIAAWLRAELAPVVDDYLNDRAVRQRGIFATDAVRKLRDGFYAGRTDAAHPLWSLVVTEAWLRWLDRSAPTQALGHPARDAAL